VFGGLPRMMTIEVTPEEFGPDSVKLDEASRAKLAAAGADVEQVEHELHGMKRGDRKLFADVVFGAGEAPRADVDEQLRWYGRRRRGADRPRRDGDLPPRRLGEAAVAW
jgi:hypothetical protein